MILEFKGLYNDQNKENSEKLFFSIFLFSSYLITEEITKFEKWKNSSNEKAGPDWDKNFLFWWIFKNMPSLRRYRDQKLISSYLITEELGCLRRCHKKLNMSILYQLKTKRLLCGTKMSINSNHQTSRARDVRQMSRDSRTK